METSISNDWLPVYKALANPIRLQIIQLLARKGPKHFRAGCSAGRQ